MQRLRTTFKRSRTPTGAEMKTQSSLEVPKQVRSASFDEIKLEAKRLQATSMSPRPEDPGGADRGRSLLSVPSTSQQRSKSFDSGGAHQSESGAFLEIPMRRFQRRKSSGDKAPPYCIHCILTENSSRMRVEEPSGSRSPAFSDTSTSDEEAEDWYSDDDSVLDPYNISIEVAETPDDTMISPQCSITVTQPPNSPSTSAMDNQPPECYSPSGRRRSITSAKLERQEAFIFNETPADPSIDPPELQESNLIVSQFFLAVPELKRDRAASVDSCFLNKSSSGKAEEVVPQSSGVLLELPTSGSATLRSRSVDIVLPTDQQAHYKALAMNSNNSAPVPKSGEGASGGSPTRSGSGGLTRVTPDWGENAVEAEHLWILINPSTDFCHCGESECVISKTSKTGTRYKCSSCKIICHASCISILERQKVQCKPTFRDVGIRSYREQTTTKHHWVHRRQQKGKCKACGKSFHSKLSFSTKEIVAINCSWCKDPYHNKETCFNSERIDEDCSLGTHHPIIVPPSWIVKLPRRGSFKSSLRKSPKKKTTTKKTPSKERSESDTSDPSVEKEERTFTLKPIPTSNVRPVIVFINPKSGGNQGIKLLQKFQWLLNPRQVFDLTQGGPRFGLELFRKVSNLRVLACGGDGTVGWVLSVIDQLTFNPPPAVGVLPLGTGNDLARALGWGGGYTDEPITKILYNIGESDVIRLDRWKLDVEKNENGETSETAKDNLPLNVVNNYFSMGVDAHIALEFHEAREAHPERFNSRLKNKMFYGQMGGKDLVKRKWKDLADYVTLVCDDKDFTPKLLECKFHAIVFLNIPSYGGGTNPWSKVPGIDTSTDDGLIEVVGLSTFQLKIFPVESISRWNTFVIDSSQDFTGRVKGFSKKPLLQAGAHGTSICQCKTATITTTKPIPMQVDGEACRLNPSVITLSLLNKAPMLTKRKRGRNINPNTTIGSLKMSVNLLNMPDYEQYHNDKTRLKQSAVNIGVVDISPVADLENTRQAITDYVEAARKAGRDVPELPPDWCFVDSCTAERFFRIDRAQEHLHFLTDIANDAVYILDQTVATPEDDSAFADLASAEPSPPSQVEDTPELSPCDEAPQQIDPENNRLGGPSGSVQVDRQEQQSSNDIPPDETGYISNLLEKTTDGVVKAAKSGDIKKLKELHGHGYSLLSIDSTGQTALHYSAQNGFKDVVKYMIASAPHSILNMADNENGSVDGVVWPRRSCESNSNVLEELPCSMDTYFAFFETPISEECPTNNELEPSMTPALTLAILLLPSPLMFLFNFHTSLEVVMGFWKALMLVSLGQTALHKAARNRHRSVCCMLVAGGASLSLIDNFGNTPRLLALEAKDHQLAAYLESQEQFQLLAEDLEGS